MFLVSTGKPHVTEHDTVFPKGERIMTTAHLKAARVAARGKPLIGVNAVLCATLALVPHAAFTIMAIMVIVGVRRAWVGR
jgi:hypothetical protein